MFNKKTPCQIIQNLEIQSTFSLAKIVGYM